MPAARRRRCASARRPRATARGRSATSAICTSRPQPATTARPLGSSATAAGRSPSRSASAGSPRRKTSRSPTAPETASGSAPGPFDRRRHRDAGGRTFDQHPVEAVGHLAAQPLGHDPPPRRQPVHDEEDGWCAAGRAPVEPGRQPVDEARHPLVVRPSDHGRRRAAGRPARRADHRRRFVDVEPGRRRRSSTAASTVVVSAAVPPLAAPPMHSRCPVERSHCHGRCAWWSGSSSRPAAPGGQVLPVEGRRQRWEPGPVALAGAAIGHGRGRRGSPRRRRRRAPRARTDPPRRPAAPRPARAHPVAPP